MRSTRYFHNNGLATHDGKTWQMCEGYDGERVQVPFRQTIPAEKKPLMFRLPDEKQMKEIGILGPGGTML